MYSMCVQYIKEQSANIADCECMHVCMYVGGELSHAYSRNHFYTSILVL